MNGICDKCRREPCRLRMDGLKKCDLYEGGETNWERLFGTPERAARTLYEKWFKTDAFQCYFCPLASERCYEPIDECAMDGCDALLEWLRGDAE